MDFSEIIKRRRTELGLTMDEVARAVGVKKSTIQRWESGGISNPRRDRIASLAAVLRLPPMYLVDAGKADGQDPALIPPEPDPAAARRAAISRHLSPTEHNLLVGFRQLSPEGKKYVLQQLTIAQKIYRKTDPAPQQAEES